MTRRDRFWERVNELFDERRDPLDDAGVQQMLGQDPGLFPELERLRARVGVMREARVRSHARAGIAIALVALLAGAIAWRALRSDGASSPSPVVQEETVAPPTALDPRPRDAGAILSFRSEVIVEGPDGRTITRFDGNELRQVREQRSGTGLLAVIDRTSFER